MKTEKSEPLANEIFERLKNINDAEQKAALEVTAKLRRSEAVSDGELLDALYSFAIRLDLANPLLPICRETLHRFMVYSGVVETPRGLKRSWLENAPLQAEIQLGTFEKREGD